MRLTIRVAHSASVIAAFRTAAASSMLWLSVISCGVKGSDFFSAPEGGQPVLDVTPPSFGNYVPSLSATGPFHVADIFYDVTDNVGPNGAPASGVDPTTVRAFLGSGTVPLPITAAGMRYTLNGIPDGPQTLNLWASDKRGNAATAQWGINIDNTAPNITMTTTPPASSGASAAASVRYTFAGSISDANPGLYVMGLYRTGASGVCGNADNTLVPKGTAGGTASENQWTLTPTFSFSFDAFNGVAAGGANATANYCAQIRAEDVARNATGGANPNVSTRFVPFSQTWAPVSQNGTANFQFSGLPTGMAGAATYSCNGGPLQTITQSSTVTLPVGTCNLTANPVTTTNVDYGATPSTQQFLITAGNTTAVVIAYAIVARLVTFQVLGLPAGFVPNIVLTRGGQQVSLGLTVLALKLAVGTWTVEVKDCFFGGKTFRSVGSATTALNVAAVIDPLAVTYAYYVARWQFSMFATTGIFSDAFGHQLFVNMWLQNTLLFIRDFPAPSATRNADQVTGTETVTITGPAPFISVTGTRAANGTLNLTGSGTAAGFPNVPALMTGTLSDLNVLTAQYRLGQPTAPTGLPNGPITYTITGTGPGS